MKRKGKNPNARTIFPASVIEFGKYRGKTAMAVLESDPAWFIWAQECLDGWIVERGLLAQAKAATEVSA